ncbi:MAG: hypothetical protein JWL98_1387 [Xanthomonadaceae bacterium]|nr:hypothetical protein [Xanthomonadaceae bacterium]
MNKTLLAVSLALAGVVAFAAPAQAARLVLLNVDAAGEGLNDPTAKAPVGANPGTTVGAQRRIAYEFAMGLWGAVLKSPVDVKIYASFQPLACTASAGVLGSAGPNWIDHDFPGAPLPNTWYHSALADSLAGRDLDPDAADPADIASRFNSNLGTTGCLETSSWYYGLDGNTPAGAINFLDVVMHEIGHGLGFSGFLDKTTGALFFDGETSRSDVYTHSVLDNVRNLRFDDKRMTDGLRATAMMTPGRLVWGGQTVTSTAALVLSHMLTFQVTAPGGIAGSYGYGTADFGPVAGAGNFSGTVKQADDGTAPNADGCQAFTPGFFTGQIALVDRGTCGFGVKALNAQNAGATGVIIANVSTSGSPTVAPGMTGGSAANTIPTISLNVADGDTFRANVGSGLTVAFVEDASKLQGADTNGHMLLYSPTVVAPGSTFSHFDTSVSPNAVMEPAISASLNANFMLDMTPSLMSDIGWGRNGGTARFRKCTTDVPIEQPGGLIPGANVLAADAVCSSNVAPGAYQACMTNFADALVSASMVTGAQDSSFRQCIRR